MLALIVVLFINVCFMVRIEANTVNKGRKDTSGAILTGGEAGIVNCNAPASCQRGLIDGSAASSLVINCNAMNACMGFIAKAPAGAGLLSLNCIVKNACRGISLQSPTKAAQMTLTAATEQNFGFNAHGDGVCVCNGVKSEDMTKTDAENCCKPNNYDKFPKYYQNYIGHHIEDELEPEQAEISRLGIPPKLLGPSKDRRGEPFDHHSYEKRHEWGDNQPQGIVSETKQDLKTYEIPLKSGVVGKNEVVKTKDKPIQRANPLTKGTYKSLQQQLREGTYRPPAARVDNYYDDLVDYYYDIKLEQARENRAYRLLNEERRNAQRYRYKY